MNVKEFVEKICQTAAQYPSYVFSQKGKIYTCVNPYYYHKVRKNSEIYEKIDGIMVDGMTMCWWIRLLWGKKVPRLSFDMSGMALDLFECLNNEENCDSIYFIGSKKEQVIQSVEIIKESYPYINIKGYREGYFTKEEEKIKVIQNLIDLSPTYIIIGMGSPLQEEFALELKRKGYNGIAFTCGGFLHQTTQGINYYPRWVNKYNLRAFYRLYKEKGLFQRLYNVLLQFPCLFFYDSIRREKAWRK